MYNCITIAPSNSKVDIMDTICISSLAVAKRGREINIHYSLAVYYKEFSIQGGCTALMILVDIEQICTACMFTNKAISLVMVKGPS